MKKLSAMVMAGVMALGMVGCGSTAAEAPAESTAPAAESTAAETTESTAEAQTETADAQTEERPEATSQYELSNVIAQKTKVQADNDNNADDKQQTHMSDKASVENENFTGNMAQNIQNAFSEIIDEVSNVNEADIVRQVVEQIKVTTGQQLSSIEIMLNPENLGKVHIAVTARQGEITAPRTYKSCFQVS